jgi:hypothetical protein
MAIPAKRADLALPTHKEIHLAEESSRILSAYMESTKSPNIQLYVLQYKSEIEHKRQKVLDELAQKSQELNMGYEQIWY